MSDQTEASRDPIAACAASHGALVDRLLHAVDRGLSCTVEEFIGEELFAEAAAVAGGHWQAILDEREREAREARDEADRAKVLADEGAGST